MKEQELRNKVHGGCADVLKLNSEGEGHHDNRDIRVQSGRIRSVPGSMIPVDLSDS
jgi:hypothetical protein